MIVVRQQKVNLQLEVKCDRCGRVETALYVDRSTISDMKRRTKDWQMVTLRNRKTQANPNVNDTIARQLCPSCLNHIKNGGSL